MRACASRCEPLLQSSSEGLTPYRSTILNVNEKRPEQRASHARPSEFESRHVRQN